MKPLSFALFSFCILMLFSYYPVSGKGNPEKPNFILIVADDLGYADLGMHGSKQIPTPYIDRLAGEGMQFLDANTPGSVCSPTRYALLTGRYGACAQRGRVPTGRVRIKGSTIMDMMRRSGSRRR